MARRRSKFWFKNEKELMKALGMKGTPGSGNGIIKEDGQNEHLIAQLKSTDANSVTIRLEDINKLLLNATVAHKIPLFINQFIDGPILISVRLEDLNDVAEYMQSGVNNKARGMVLQVSDTKNKKVQETIKSGGKEALKVRAEREEAWSNRKGNKKWSR